MKVSIWIQDDTEHGYQLSGDSGVRVILPRIGEKIDYPDKYMNPKYTRYEVIDIIYTYNKDEVNPNSAIITVKKDETQ